jgi:hypothetical protein
MLKALPWKLIGWAALGLIVASLFVALKIERAQNGKLKTQVTACAAARQADRSAYESAQRVAAANNKAKVAQIEKRQEAVNNEITSDLNARLERLRSELRAKSSAPQGAPDQPGSPSNGGSAKGADGQAGVCYSSGDVLRAAENEERHDQLINWVEKQLQIPR